MLDTLFQRLLQVFLYYGVCMNVSVRRSLEWDGEMVSIGILPMEQKCVRHLLVFDRDGGDDRLRAVVPFFAEVEERGVHPALDVHEPSFVWVESERNGHEPRVPELFLDGVQRVFDDVSFIIIYDGDLLSFCFYFGQAVGQLMGVDLCYGKSSVVVGGQIQEGRETLCVFPVCFVVVAVSADDQRVRMLFFGFCDVMGQCLWQFGFRVDECLGERHELNGLSDVREFDGQVIAPVVDHPVVRVFFSIHFRQRVDVLCVDALADGESQFSFFTLVRFDAQVFCPYSAVHAIGYQFRPFYLFLVLPFPVGVDVWQHPCRLLLQFVELIYFRQEPHLFLEIQCVLEVEEGDGILSQQSFFGMLLVDFVGQFQCFLVIDGVSCHEGEVLSCPEVHGQG